MTVMTRPEQQLWSSMPGWGIVADLTPPELLASRHLKFLRKLMFSGLAVLLVLCAAGYAMAVLQHSSASSALGDQQLRTTQLQSQAGKYARVTQIQGTVAQVQGQVAILMAGDVDLQKLIGAIRSARPGTMSVMQESLTLSAAGATGQAGGVAGTQLDTSGHIRIGTVTLSGAAQTLDDLPRYIDKLKTITGIVDPIPTSNQVDQSSVSYSLSFGLTDQVLSHRFTASRNGSK